MGTAIVLLALLALVGACLKRLIGEHRRGELCECIGDCSKCKIHCRNNEKYYGTSNNEVK